MQDCNFETERIDRAFFRHLGVDKVFKILRNQPRANLNGTPRLDYKSATPQNLIPGLLSFTRQLPHPQRQYQLAPPSVQLVCTD